MWPHYLSFFGVFICGPLWKIEVDNQINVDACLIVEMKESYSDYIGDLTINPLLHTIVALS
jgi:hypothetical protein